MDKNYIYEVTMYDKDGGKVVQKIAEDSETYADLVIDLQARNSKYIRGEITRTSDGFVMYDTSHDSFLRAYEELDTEEYIADKPLHIQLARSEKPSVYIDVDGTAAYWYKDGRGLSYPEQILDPKNHYYRDLEPHPFIVDLAERLVRDGYDVCVLSATARECITDRFEWIDRHMPFIPKENVFLCPVGADKKQYCKDNSDISVLIDDYDKNLREWDGQAVKSVNSINSPTPDFPCLMTSGLEQYRSENKSLYIEELNSSVSFIENILDYYEKSVENNKKDYEQWKTMHDSKLIKNSRYPEDILEYVGREDETPNMVIFSKGLGARMGYVAVPSNRNLMNTMTEDDITLVEPTYKENMWISSLWKEQTGKTLDEGLRWVLYDCKHSWEHADYETYAKYYPKDLEFFKEIDCDLGNKDNIRSLDYCIEQNAKIAKIAFSKYRGVLQSAKIAGFAKPERLIALDPSGDFILRHREKKNDDIER